MATLAPTVRPPSRMANLKPSSMAIGLITSTVTFTFSPGITISVPLGSSTEPHGVVAGAGSLVIGLAVLDRRLEPGDAWRASRVDEDYQCRKWGEDEEADEAAARARGDLLAAAEFLRLSLA